MKQSNSLGVLCDYPEEEWPSMDLCAEMLVRNLSGRGGVRPIRYCPAFRRRAQRLSISHSRDVLYNADRLANRFWDYPRAVRRLKDRFDWFHICDHSYAQLVHELPLERTGVYCHDLDTFRCLLEPKGEPRPTWFRAMMWRVLGGLRKAAVVFCSTELLKRQLRDTGLVESDHVVIAPYGVADEFGPEPSDLDTSLPLPFDRRVPFILHVGSTIPRKRIDVLLKTFAMIQSQLPGLKLVQVGGTWTSDQKEQITRLGIAAALIQLQGLERKTLAALYRNAAVVLLPSAAEGFGLPVIEALACGSVVVASDLPVLREVGGPAVLYRPVGDADAWAALVGELLEGRIAPAPRDVRLSQAARYTWSRQAEIIANTYRGLPDRCSGSPKKAVRTLPC